MLGQILTALAAPFKGAGQVTCRYPGGIERGGMVTIGATTLLVMEIDEIEPGIRELRCTSAMRPWRRGDELLSVYSHVLPDGPHVYRSLEDARASLKVIPLPTPLRPGGGSA